MIEEFAVVTQRFDDHVMLEIERRTACGLCGQKRGCGNATWGKLLRHDSHEFPADSEIDVNVGDSVVVGIDERIVLGSVFYLYMVPLLAMLAGALVVDTLFDNEFYVMLATAASLVLAFAWVKGHLMGYGRTKKSYGKKYRAVVLRHADATVSCNNLKQKIASDD